MWYRIILMIGSLSLLTIGVISIFKSNESKDLINSQFNSLKNEYHGMVSINESRSMISINIDENTVFFQIDSYELNTESKKTLTPLAKTLNRKNNITITGHTCSLGDDKHNDWLSEKRAESVSQFIQFKNPEVKRIRTFGFGEAVPIADNETESGRKLNRRVEIDIGIEEEMEEEIEEAKLIDWNKLVEKYQWFLALFGLITSFLTVYEFIKNRHRV